MQAQDESFNQHEQTYNNLDRFNAMNIGNQTSYNILLNNKRLSVGSNEGNHYRNMKALLKSSSNLSNSFKEQLQDTVINDRQRPSTSTKLVNNFYNESQDNTPQMQTSKSNRKLQMDFSNKFSQSQLMRESTSRTNKYLQKYKEMNNDKNQQMDTFKDKKTKFKKVMSLNSSINSQSFSSPKQSPVQETSKKFNHIVTKSIIDQEKEEMIKRAKRLQKLSQICAQNSDIHKRLKNQINSSDN